MKLASFSDCVDVFVVVDTPAGRLCSGNGGLVEAFAASALTPLPSDLRLYVDPFNPPQMAPITIPPPPPPSTFSQRPNLSLTSLTRERELRIQPQKRRKPPQGNLDVDSPIFKAKKFLGDSSLLMPSTNSSFPTQSSTNNEAGKIDDSMNTQFDADVTMEATFPSANGDASSSELHHHRSRTSLTNRTLSHDKGLSHDNDRLTSLIKTEILPPSSSKHDSIVADDDFIELSSGEDSSSSYSIKRDHPPSSLTFAESSSVELVPTPFGSIDNATDDVISYVNANVPSLKLEAFRVASGELVSSRGSVENRLASSVAYDAGKALADIKPEVVGGDAAKAFFNHHFETWLSQFDHLREHLKTMIPNGKPELGQTFTLLALLKMTARAAFKQKLKSKGKR